MPKASTKAFAKGFKAGKLVINMSEPLMPMLTTVSMGLLETIFHSRHFDWHAASVQRLVERDRLCPSTSKSLRDDELYEEPLGL